MEESRGKLKQIAVDSGGNIFRSPRTTRFGGTNLVRSILVLGLVEEVE